MNKLLGIITSLILLGSTVIVAQGKFSGYMFGDYYYNVLRDGNFGNLSNVASPSGTTAFQAFQFRRIYFTYDSDISEKFTTRFRIEADQSANTSNGKIGVFVKDAYLKWKNIFSGSDLIFGIQPPPTYEISEAAWGYRSLEKTIMDLRGIVSPRDQGISLKGKLIDDGKLDYWVMFANNSANSPETDKYKRYYAHIHLKPITNLQATLYVDYKAQADIVDSYHADSKLNNSALTTSLFVGYSEPFQYNIGFEGFLQPTSNGLKDTLAREYSTKSGMGISLFGSYFIMPELVGVLRYDRFDPCTDDKGKDPVNVTTVSANANVARDYIIVGLSWKLDRNVSLMPNILVRKRTIHRKELKVQKLPSRLV